MKKNFLRIICFCLLFALLSCLISCTAANKSDTSEASENKYQAQYYYVLNTNSKKIHKPSCGTGDLISPQNRSTTNQSIEELYKIGYTKCGNCFK